MTVDRVCIELQLKIHFYGSMRIFNLDYFANQYPLTELFLNVSLYPRFTLTCTIHISRIRLAVHENLFILENSVYERCTRKPIYIGEFCL